MVSSAYIYLGFQFGSTYYLFKGIKTGILECRMDQFTESIYPFNAFIRAFDKQQWQKCSEGLHDLKNRMNRFETALGEAADIATGNHESLLVSDEKVGQ